MSNLYKIQGEKANGADFMRVVKLDRVIDCGDGEQIMVFDNDSTYRTDTNSVYGPKGNRVARFCELTELGAA
jgi:hypothetical protein